MLARLVKYWVYGGFLSGWVLLFLTPLIARFWSAPQIAIYVLLPIYMLHQYEEHDEDRFRQSLNRVLGKGKEVLSPLAVFVINVPGVWGILVLSLYLALWVNLGLGLIAVYLTLVNAVVHLIHAVIFRSYNPGLLTAILLFVPFGGYGFWQIESAGAGTILFHVVGLVTAIAIHVAILLHVRSRMLGLNRAT